MFLKVLEQDFFELKGNILLILADILDDLWRISHLVAN